MAFLRPDELKRLSASERLALIEQLWDSLSESELTLPDAQAAELDRRLAAGQDDPSQGVTWEQLKDELTARRL